MPISFETLIPGEEYERPELAKLWGYRSWNALGRGVVTPTGEKTVVLFVTREKQETLTQYQDQFEGDELHWEGEKNHGNDERIVEAEKRGDEIHVFFRERHHSPFTYYGRVRLKKHRLLAERPSKFVFSTTRSEASALSGLATEESAQGEPEAQFVPDEEGRKFLRQHVAYERSIKNRAEAIRIHGTRCNVCGFDFNAFYGRDFARDYIEVHHLRSVTSGVQVVLPVKDLVTLCANCHKMAHRRRGGITAVAELRELIARRKPR